MKDIRFADDRDPKTLHHEIEKAIIAGLDAKSIHLFDLTVLIEQIYWMRLFYVVKSRFSHDVLI